MRITIVGAGAIGGTAGAYLSEAGHDVLLVDNVAEHVAAINTRGLRISGIRGDRTFRVRACLPAELTGPLEFVILAVKAQHTEAALAPVVPLLARDGFVVSMQNGLNEEVIARHIGAERTVGCFVHFGADYQEPGHILLGNEHPIYFGELDGRTTPRVEMIAATLRAVMPTVVTDNIWGWLWTKMCYGSLYFAGALMDIPLHEVLQRREYRPSLGAVVTETVRVAHALGHTRLEQIGDFRPAAFADGYTPAAEAVFDKMAQWDGKSLKVFTGIQRDIMVRKRKTEVDHQPGAVAERAARLGIPVPHLHAVIRMIKEIEDGRRPMGWANLDALAAVERR
ncbi:MAG: 2-dehydropantoate 2-reductase [Armatimonadota bacterium]|nr:2-dehydropantoate 2-reductase [Armatimonadota bacterium]